VEEKVIALSNTIFPEHLPKDTKALVFRPLRMPSSFWRPLISWRYAYLRYACLRYAYLRYAYLRYAFLCYAYLRYASSRYAYLRYAFRIMPICVMPFRVMPICVLPFRVMPTCVMIFTTFPLCIAPQLRLDAFTICNIESSIVSLLFSFVLMHVQFG